MRSGIRKIEKTSTIDNASYDRPRPAAGNPLPSSSISFGMTLVIAIAFGVAAANIYFKPGFPG
jgi:hypothetical protein